ncbi:MAG: flagellar hook-length control protein FliK [Roseburia sp.]|nr:flagellar hook-length control protein FliK [Roseburia sp.]
MDSFMSGFSHYTTRNAQIGHAYTGGVSGGTAPSAGTASNAQNVDVSQLQTGDTFQGEIASVNGEDVQIQLANGQYMAAKLERDVQVALGQTLSLQVLSNKDNRLVLKPVYDSNMQMQRVSVSALKTANLAVTEKNLQLVAKLIENGMPINRNTLMAFNRLALQHPQADIADLIKLTKLQLPVTDKNIAQYESYQNMEHKLLDGVREASDEVFKLYDLLSGGKSALSGAAAQGAVAQEAAAQGAVGQEMPLRAAGQYMEKVVQFLADEAGTQPENPAAAVTAESANPAQNGAEAAPEPASASNVLPEQTEVRETLPQAGQPTGEGTANINTAGTTAPQTEAHWQSTVNRLRETPTGELPDRITNLIKEGALDIKGVNRLLSDSALSKLLTPEQKGEIFSSEPFKTMVRRELQRQWTLSPQELPEEGKTQEFYERLVRQSNRLMQIMNDAMQESGGGGAAPARALSNMRDNVEFMNQMNQMFSYVQLPLRLTESQAHGDLYVYTNKKNLARRDGMLTAFLHLDMEHLGGLDISISLQTEKNQVTTKFYLEEDAISLIEEHIDELTQRLARKGYQCRNTIQAKDEDKTVLQHMEEQVAGGMAPLSYQSFDMRT